MFPSPVSVLVSVNANEVTPACPAAGARVNRAVTLPVATAFTVTLPPVNELDSPFTESVIVSVVVYVPAAAYTCVGFCKLDVPPSPKLHSHPVILAPPVV